MIREDLNLFVKDFNKTKKSIGDFIKISQKHNIKIDELGESIETDNFYEWQISGLGSVFQCKGCLSLEFVEIGKNRKH